MKHTDFGYDGRTIRGADGVSRHESGPLFELSPSRASSVFAGSHRTR